MTKKLVRVTKKEARDLYRAGGVYVLPSKVRPSFDNFWIQPMLLSVRKPNGSISLRTFDKVLNEYKYYNCNDELGNCTRYYKLVTE